MPIRVNSYATASVGSAIALTVPQVLIEPDDLVMLALTHTSEPSNLTIALEGIDGLELINSAEGASRGSEIWMYAHTGSAVSSSASLNWNNPPSNVAATLTVMGGVGFKEIPPYGITGTGSFIGQSTDPSGSIETPFSRSWAIGILGYFNAVYTLQGDETLVTPEFEDGIEYVPILISGSGVLNPITNFGGPNSLSANRSWTLATVSLKTAKTFITGTVNGIAESQASPQATMRPRGNAFGDSKSDAAVRMDFRPSGFVFPSSQMDGIATPKCGPPEFAGQFNSEDQQGHPGATPNVSGFTFNLSDIPGTGINTPVGLPKNPTQRGDVLMLMFEENVNNPNIPIPTALTPGWNLRYSEQLPDGPGPLLPGPRLTWFDKVVIGDDFTGSMQFEFNMIPDWSRFQVMSFRKVNNFIPFFATASIESFGTAFTTGSVQNSDRPLEIRCVIWNDITNRATGSLGTGWATAHRTDDPSPNNDYATYFKSYDPKELPSPDIPFTSPGADNVIALTTVYNCGPGNNPVSTVNRPAIADGLGQASGIGPRIDFVVSGSLFGSSLYEAEALIVTKSVDAEISAEGQIDGGLRMDYRSFAGTISGQGELTSQRLGITRLLESTVAGLAQTEGFGTRIRFLSGESDGIAMLSKSAITGIRNLGRFARHMIGQAAVSGQARIDLKMVPAEIQAQADVSGKVQVLILLPDSEIAGSSEIRSRPLRKTVNLVSPGQIVVANGQAMNDGTLRMDYRSFSGIIGASSVFEKTDFFFINRPASQLTASLVTGEASVLPPTIFYHPFDMEGGPVEPIVIYVEEEGIVCYLTEAQMILLGKIE